MQRFLHVTALIATWAVLQTGTLRAQVAKYQSAAPRAKAAPLRANRSSDFELLDTRYRFENDGTGSVEVVAKIRILNKIGVWQWSELGLDYKPFSERLEIPYVRVVRQDGSMVTVVTGEVVERANIPAGVRALDHDEKRIVLPRLVPGDLLEYKVVRVILSPLAEGQFWAQHNFQPSSVMDEQLEIDVPSGRAVKLKTRASVDAWATRDSNRQIYHWKSSNPTLEYRQSNTDLWHETADVQLSSFTNWEEVGRWYAALEKNRRITTPEIRAKADELTEGLHSDLEKVEAIYDFVAKKIKYLSLMSLGVGGYVPSSADDVLRKGSGDCKDKVTLLAALLEAKGMHASSVLINPSRELEAEVPSPWPFTHVITMLLLGREKIWMDPSSAVLPFGMLDHQVRGKKGLVMPSDGAPHFEETPPDLPASDSWLQNLDGLTMRMGLHSRCCCQDGRSYLVNGEGSVDSPFTLFSRNAIQAPTEYAAEQTAGVVKISPSRVELPPPQR
jgi:hypothetical protein